MTHIHLACNDYRNGNFTGNVESVSIYDADAITPYLMLTGNRVSCRLLYSKNSRKPRFLYLGHLRQLRVLSFTPWAGNWCWDAAQLSPDDTAKVANYLKRRGWHCEGGYEDMGDKWEQPDYVFTTADFNEVMS